MAQDGDQAIIDGRLQITSSRAVTFLVTMATGVREVDPDAACKATLDAAALHSYEQLLERHQKDHRKLFRRFDIAFDIPIDDGRTIPQRLEALRAGSTDPGLFALVMQHRRYLLIAASRPGSLPSNLQGIWTDQQQGPWNSDYHFNINLQMNYWLAEPTGLPDCVAPLIDWIESVVPKGELAAKELYGCRGWVMHHLSDCWGAVEPFDGIWGLWPWGGVWLCLHMHDHWAYAQDPALLERVWPLLRGAARFVIDYLVEAPEHTAHAGFVTTCPSHSPENKFLDVDNQPRLFTYGSTMDFGICRAFLSACIVELETLGNEAAFLEKLRATLRRLPPIQVSPTTGGIQEWAEDYVEADPGHRHISHLFDVYPGEAISLSHTPRLADAAKATLRRKVRYQPKDSHGSPGWTLNWTAIHWCRLGNGNEAMAALRRLLTEASTPNLLTFAHDQPQVADACGTAAALCEMLVRTSNGVITLLPALPDELCDGRVIGLRLPNALMLDMEWEAARLKTAHITASRPTVLRVAAPANYNMHLLTNVVEVNAEGAWSVTLNAGDRAVILSSGSPVN